MTTLTIPDRILTEAETQTLINAVFVAAERFEADAKVITGTRYDGLKTQFEKQAREAREIGALLQSAGEVTVSILPDEEEEAEPPEPITCSFCRKPVDPEAAHRHQGVYVGPCCWDERLRASE